MKRNLVRLIVFVGLMALAVAPSAHAAPLVISTVTDLGGTWLYEYKLENPVDSGEDIYDFGVDFFGEAFSITKPSDWSDPFYAPGTDTVPSFIDWFSPDPSFDVTPGAIVGGFSFQSLLAPGTIVYHIATTAVAIDGETVGPNPVPEPGTLLLLGMGATGLIARRRRSKLRD